MPVTYYGSITYYGYGSAKERFQHFLDSPPEAISIDVETISTKERVPLGFAIAFSPDEAIYFQVHPEPPEELELLKPLLFNPNVCKIAHYALFDLGVLPLIPNLAGFDRSNIFDTNTAARLLGYIETALNLLAPVEMMIEDAKSFMARHHAKNMLEAPPDEVANKCQKDARAAFQLYLDYKDKIAVQYAEYFKVEMAVIPILIDLSMRGLAIAQPARAELEAKLEDEVEFYRRQLEQYGIEKPGSSQQIGYMLGKRGSFLPFTKGKRQLSTRVGELEFLDDPMAAAVLGWRQKSKLLNTYIKPIAGEDRFYTEYYLDTVVGRLNSKNRNIQNIPPDCRYIFLPDSGIFVTGDFSQEHLYILAHFSGDRDMKRVYEDGYMDGDIHSFTAKQMFGTVTPDNRRLAKTLNYSIVYGATDKTISEQAKIKDRKRCAELLDRWFKAFPGATDWIQTVQRAGVKSGWAEPTLFGRKIRIPEEVNQWGRIDTEAMKRKATNYPILGSDGEIMKRALILCNSKGLGPPIMAITLHDSITFDGAVSDRIPKEELEHIAGFKIPFEIKETVRWE
mgnify:CR=1 FL=1